jgi:signal peptidase I
MNACEENYTRSMCTYAGMSMYPVLRDSDLLLIKPYDKQRIRVGDIVLFRSAEGGILLVHRVVDVSPRGVRTRGDYGQEIDPDYVQPEEIRGKVVALWRNGKKRPIFGGGRGLIFARMIWWYGLIKRLVFWPLLIRILRCPYYQEFLFTLVSRWLISHITVFQTNHSDRQTRMFLGSYRIGLYDSMRGRWHLQFPFQFLIHSDRVSIPSQDTPNHQHEESL